MKLNELLALIRLSAEQAKCSKPYIVGGFPRDVILKRADRISDLDITCGDESSFLLGKELVKKLPKATFMVFNDGHGKIRYDKFSIDFSSNFRSHNIKDKLKKFDILKPTPMQEEVYSRDFTINSLLMPLDLTSVVDITKRGLDDIEKKIVDTCLAPEVTLTDDPRRIIRIVYMCGKLDMMPSDRVVDFVSKNSELLEKVSPGYIKEKINKAIDYNNNLSNDIITTLNIRKYLPKSDTYEDALELSLLKNQIRGLE